MKKEICGCGNNFDRPTEGGDIGVLRTRGDLSLIFSDVDVEVNWRRFGRESCPDCSRKKSLEEIEQFILIDLEFKPLVDWEAYIAHECGRGRSRYINDVLVKLGVLSGYGEGNWIAMSQIQGCLNPKWGNGKINLYFTSPDDVVEYAETLSRRKSHCHAMKISHAFSVFGQ
ncbi:MAG: hypothetical protein Q8L10_04385 [Candidatus Moranbacteria bacterium]|nr:hypothetical protein [Candidatus Moranbacteria bacterium]